MIDQRSGNIDLRPVLQALRRRWWILVLCAALAPATAIAVSLLQEKQYTAHASLLFRDPQFDQKIFGSAPVDESTDPAREAATNVELVSLEKVAALTAKRLDNGMTGSDVSEAIEITARGQSDVVSIQATAPNPKLAADLANSFAGQYIAFRREADRAKLRAAQKPVEEKLRRLPASRRGEFSAQVLAKGLNQLNVLSSLQTGNAELVQRARVPESPSSPKPLQNAGIGFIAGTLLGFALVLLVDRLDRRLRDAGEVEQTFGRPVLSTLPESRALRHPDPALLSVSDAEREAFRMLRANLRYFNISRDIGSVLVTSSGSGDGKSTVAWGLAVASASAGARTLLVEADLRHPSFAARYNLRSRHGLTSVLTRDLDLTDAVTVVPLGTTQNDQDPGRSMDVLLSGPLPPNPVDLIESDQMAELMRRAEDEYELVVIDTPPTSVVSDAVPLLSMVGGVLVVSRLGTTTRDAMRRLHHQLEHLGAPVLGLVINSADQGTGTGYGYAYGYYYAPAAEPAHTASPNGGPVAAPRVPTGHAGASSRAVDRRSSPAEPTAATAGEPDGEGRGRAGDGGVARADGPTPGDADPGGAAGPTRGAGATGGEPSRRRLRDWMR